MTSLDTILNYNLVQSEGAIVSKREIEFLSDRESYKSGENIRIRFNLGDRDFVWGLGCKLTFNLEYEDDPDVGGDDGRRNIVATKSPETALGNNVFSLLFKDFIMTNDRVEIEDIRQIDEISHTLSDLCSLRFKQTHGQTMGMCDPQYQIDPFNSTLNDESTTTRFVDQRNNGSTTPVPDVADLQLLDDSVSIPMHFISNFFSSLNLLPMNMMGTGETLLQFKLKNANLAAIWARTENPGVIGYTIANMKLHLDVYTLSTQLFSEVKNVMNTTGLEMSYMSWDHVRQVDTKPAGAGSEGTRKIEFFRGVKRATKLVAFVKGAQNEDVGNIVQGARARDSLSRYDFSVIKEYLFRVGSERIPANTFINGPSEAYTSSLLAWNILGSCDEAPAPTFREFQRDRHFLLASLEKDPGTVPHGAFGTETASNRRISLEINMNQRPADIDVVATNDRKASGAFVFYLYVGYMKNLKITSNGTIRVE